METDTLFEVTPEAATTAAINQAEDNADADWYAEALWAVLWLAKRKDYFTTDDVWEAMANIEATTHEPRAIGAVMRQASRDGQCTPTDYYNKSTRRACHSRPLRVWKSLICS